MLLVVSWPAYIEQGDTDAVFGLEGKTWGWLVMFKIISAVI